VRFPWCEPGWGYRETAADNAVVQAHTPHFDSLFGSRVQVGQVGFLDACEREVGLPVGQIGNSEVGHMNIGAGRVVYQDICTIDNAIEDGSLTSNEALVAHIDALKASGGTCHLLGLVSPGGVHAMQDHVAALANAVAAAGVPVVVHAFTDGRDVPPSDAVGTMPDFLASLSDGVTVGTVTGRYYSMDRDNRWERVITAYDVMVDAKGVAPGVATPLEAIDQAYADELTDEFINPTVIGDYGGMKDGDGLLCANFRADRAREILQVLADPAGFPDGCEDRGTRVKFADVCGMVKYSDLHEGYMSLIFPVKDIQKPLGEVVADHGLKQLRTAETEKFPHVTFFFNGGREDPYENEDRILVPSPKVATYDLQPEMSCPEVGERLCAAVDAGTYDFICVNFANPDMVGHTGDLQAAMAACASVDVCLGNLNESVAKQQGILIVTADHGNCEKMYEEATGEPHTAHTLNKVPFILVDHSGGEAEHKVRSGRLADIAPTVLQLLGLPQPPEMTGESLIVPPETIGSLQDGPKWTRPPMEGLPA
jgi:2,3-bisphosphoglycerate-independent phosphoglycerate mutase